MSKSYAEQWLEAVRAKQEAKPVEPAPVVSPHWHHDNGAPAWKPWAEMTPEERRKALETREEKKDATPLPTGR
jgi:hypothetical protein